MSEETNWKAELMEQFQDDLKRLNELKDKETNEEVLGKLIYLIKSKERSIKILSKKL